MRTLFLCGAGNGEGVRLARQVERTRPRFERIVLLDDFTEVVLGLRQFALGIGQLHSG